MPDVGIGIDPIDVDILREMYRGQRVTVAGVDPRLNVSRIAERLRTSRARVTNRLRRWSEAGFLRRYDVWPNPALFGLRGWSVDVRFRRRLEKPDLLRRVSLVDGVVSAQEFLGDWAAVQLLAPDERACERRLQLVRGLEGIAEVTTPLAWNAPEPRRALSALDVRIVRALRREPRATLTETSRAVGISTRTMTSRYAALLDGWAVWFVPLFDFTRLALPVVSLNLRLAPGASPSSAARTIRREFPWTLEFGGVGRDAAAESDIAVLFVTLPSAASIEDLERFACRVPGVREAETLVMVRTHAFTDWFDAALAEIATASSPTGLAPARRGRPPRAPTSAFPGERRGSVPAAA